MPQINSAVFSTPQKETMKSSWALIHAHINSLQLDFLPYLQEKLPRLQSTTLLADQAFNDYLGKLLAQVRNIDLDSITRTRERVEADTLLSAERRADALNRITDRYNARLAELKAALLTTAQMLLQRVDDVTQITLELPDTTLQNSLQRQLETLTESKTELTSRLTTVSEDRRLLNETISTFEQGDFFKDLQALLPTAEELAGLALPDPKLALVQAGLARLQALLGKVSASITYQELLNEREKINLRYSELLAQSRGIDDQTRALSEKLEQLTGVSSLNNARNVWVLEARKAPDSLYAYFETYLTTTAERLPEQQNINELKHYLESFQGVWRSL